MAVQPGEENVATLFADVHYFYGPPTDNPPHHRFDKGSYVYLFEDASAGRSRVEIANQPGTDSQDAFDGYLDSTHIRYSYKQQCMVTITIGDVDGYEHWHLPTYDPKNENKYHYKLHSVDIYFWTQQDAHQFVNGIRRLLPPNHVEVLDEPGPPPRHEADVSAVVQKLEKAAISDSTYGSTAQAQNGIPSFAPPPMSAVSGNSPSPQPQAQQFAPIAYNPAAPAAPEAIRHREKTPPPEDGGLNPLHATLAHDATTPFSPGLPMHPSSGLSPLSPGIPPPAFHSPPGAPSFPGPPIGSPGLPPSGYGSLGPSHPGLSRAATMPVHGMTSPMASPYGAQFPGSPGFPGIQQAQQQHLTPTPPISSPGLPPPPPGGFSQYNYSQSGTPAAGGADYGIHQQAYRPTEGETVHYQPKKEVRGKVEENAGRLERGVTGMLKKFEKKFG